MPTRPLDKIKEPRFEGRAPCPSLGPRRALASDAPRRGDSSPRQTSIRIPPRAVGAIAQKAWPRPKPVVTPIRGGTDGAELTYKGLLCPNFCTGGTNFHGRFETVSIQAMDKVTDLIEKIVVNYAKKSK